MSNSCRLKAACSNEQKRVSNSCRQASGVDRMVMFVFIDHLVIMHYEEIKRLK